MSVIDYTNVDYKGFKQMMIATLQELLPEYTDTSETDAGMVIMEANCRAMDIISYYQNVQANECFLPTLELRNNALKWCKALGYTPRSCTPAKYIQYFEVKKPSGSSTLTIPKSTIVRTGEKVTGDTEYFTTLDELTINFGVDLTTQTGYVGEAEAEDTYIFSVDLAHGTIVAQETLGVADGSENQRYTLKNTPVSLPDYDEDGFALLPRVVNGVRRAAYPDGYDSARDIQVLVGGAEWTLKNSFIDSTSTDTDYLVEVAQDNTVTVIFGDGVNGAKPIGEVIVTYRNGGGTSGNVGAKTINILPSSIDGVVSTYNPDMPYSEGTDKETVSEIKVNAPNANRTKWGCIQADDYADRVKQLFPQIMLATSFRKADRESVTDLTEEALKVIDTIQICVLLNESITDADGNYKKLKDFIAIDDTDNPIAVELQASIMDRLMERALVGTYIELKPYVSKSIKLDCTLIATTGYEFDDVKEEVLDYLDDYFSIGQIASGQTLSLNELESSVYTSVSGIRAFRVNSFTVGDVENTTSLDVDSNLWEIIELESCNIHDSRG